MIYLSSFIVPCNDATTKITTTFMWAWLGYIVRIATQPTFAPIDLVLVLSASTLKKCEKWLQKVWYKYSRNFAGSKSTNKELIVIIVCWWVVLSKLWETPKTCSTRRFEQTTVTIDTDGDSDQQDRD